MSNAKTKKVKTNMEKLRSFLQKQKYIKAAYIFGSVARGQESPLSDIDFAFYLESSLDKSERHKKHLFLINELSSILETDNIDVVIMNDSPLVLNFNIIRDGKLLTGKDDSDRVRFESVIMSKYLDRQYYDMRYTEIGLNRIAEKGLL